MKRLLQLGALAAVTVAATAAEMPEWIWFQKTASAETRCFRKTFTVEGKVTKAELSATADDALEVFLNGERVLQSTNWRTAAKVDVTRQLRPGRNVVGIRARNGDGSPAGALAKLEFATDKGAATIVTDASWKAAAGEADGWLSQGFDDTAWSLAKSLGKLGISPWGDVLAGAPTRDTKREATPAEMLYTLPGFQVELVYSGEPAEGSWVTLTKDDQGRLIISPQWAKSDTAAEEQQRGLLRLTLGADGQVARREYIAKPLYDAQGLLFTHGALYAVVNRYSTKFESGLYRLRDTGNGQYDDIVLLKKLPGGGEHGPHAVRLGPDGKVYVLCGNHTKLPEGLAADSPHRHYAEDHLLPRQWDGNGHATGILAPGGHVLRTDLDGGNWELFCAGFRNAYAMAFNADGECFTFDSDMEWDWGMPWYRPTRVNHCVSGGEYGWRSGTGKWPAYYADSLGAFDIGIGSPTGVEFGTGAKFPAPYQRALYLLDWTYGRILVAHFTPEGASYKGTFENFVCPLGLVNPGAEKRPLNLTGVVIGDDGALYFTIGGRNTVSALYRVRYVGKEKTLPAKLSNSTGTGARRLRHQLEAFHGHPDPKAVRFLWPYLNSGDRTIRYAARVALESQPVAEWQGRALAESKKNAGLTALLALARVGGSETQAGLLKALKRFPLASLSESQRLDKLRILEVSFSRQGRPSREWVNQVIDGLAAAYPNRSEWMNRELSQLLIYLEAPGAIGNTLELIATAATQEEQMHYLFHLRTAKGWTPDQRRQYFKMFAQQLAAVQNVQYSELDQPGSQPAALPIRRTHPDQVVKWFDAAGRPYGDGASFANFLRHFYAEAVANLSAVERAQLEPLLARIEITGKEGKKVSVFPAPKLRAFVKEWTMADLLPELDRASARRNFNRGQQAFVDAQCILCHRFGNEGGGIGPDLTAVASRFSRRDILESILEPSKVVSEQFQKTTVVLLDGDSVTGQLLDETADKLVLRPNPLQPEVVEVKKTEVKSRTLAKLSPMPEGLVNALSKEDLLDLLAFLESAGSSSHAAFHK